MYVLPIEGSPDGGDDDGDVLQKPHNDDRNV